MEKGSVITVDSAVITLANIAAQNDEYNTELFPYLLKHLETCRPKDVPQHAEKILIAENTENKTTFIAVLKKRITDLNERQVKRVQKVIKKFE